VKNYGEEGREIGPTQTIAPKLSLKKIGIVARDYGCKFPNGRRDFSDVFPDVLKLLDGKGCDAVLFSLFSIISRKSFDLHKEIDRVRLKKIKAVFLEEFHDYPKRRLQSKQRETKRFVILYRSNGQWIDYELEQSFGTLPNLAKLRSFISDEIPKKRSLGNCCVLLCGEINGVIALNHTNVVDRFGLRAAIPKTSNIILNPSHDLMFRPEMKKKRKYFSRKSRWMISVWNKGKKDKRGKTRDGSSPAWTIFHDGIEKEIEYLPTELGVEIGILNCKRA
jgi:hypothetical protein